MVAVAVSRTDSSTVCSGVFTIKPSLNWRAQQSVVPEDVDVVGVAMEIRRVRKSMSWSLCLAQRDKVDRSTGASQSLSDVGTWPVPTSVKRPSRANLYSPAGDNKINASRSNKQSTTPPHLLQRNRTHTVPPPHPGDKTHSTQNARDDTWRRDSSPAVALGRRSSLSSSWCCWVC